MPQVQIDIFPGGKIAVEGKGFTGKACDGIIDPFVRALGRDPASLAQEYKPEYLTEGGQQAQAEGMG